MALLPKLVDLLQELKRRRVIRVAVVYLGGAFVLLQAADLVLPVFQVPDWSYTLLVVLLALGFPITLAVAWAFDLTPGGVVRTAPVPPEVARVRALDPAAVAILPFTDLGGAEDDYFSQGITDDILAQVARLRDLKVISRTSASQYRDARKPLPTIARELGVAYIVEGSVRRTADRVRIVAQLIDARTDAHVWAETYDRPLEDVFSIQSDVARRVAGALRAKLSPGDIERLGRTPTRDMGAYELYLRARREWNRRTPSALERSIGLLDRALAADPRFALAHAALADSSVMLGVYGVAPPAEVMEPARTAAEAAIELDPGAGEPHAALACVHALYDWDWPRAEAGFLRAIELSPHYATAHQWYAMNLLVPLGRFDEARAALDVALDLDPLSPAARASLGVLAYYRRDAETGVRVFAELLSAHPDFAAGHYFHGLCLSLLDRPYDAAAALSRAVDRSERSVETVAALAWARARAGDRGHAERLLAQLQERSAQEYVSPARLAVVHLALGDPERALGCLRDAHAGRAIDMAWIGVRPTLDPLRDRPEFGAIAQDVLGGSGLAVR